MTCSACGGAGGGYEDVLVGYVSRDMASDAGEMSMEGEPMYQPVEHICEHCNGSGLEPMPHSLALLPGDGDDC